MSDLEILVCANLVITLVLLVTRMVEAPSIWRFLKSVSTIEAVISRNSGDSAKMLAQLLRIERKVIEIDNELRLEQKYPAQKSRGRVTTKYNNSKRIMEENRRLTDD